MDQNNAISPANNSDIASGEKEKILIVDDDPSMGILLKELLEKRNYHPLVATHPLKALEIFKEEKPGMAFLDINMPDMDGLELGRRMLSIIPEVELVFITGFGTFDNAIEAIRMGASDYLRKPFNLAEFEICLKRHEDRKLLKEKVRQAQQRYYYLVQNIPVLIMVFSRDLELQFINRASARILEVAPDEATSKQGWFLDCVHPDDREQVKKIMDGPCKARTHSRTLECRLRHKRGYYIHVLLRTIPVDSCPDNPDKELFEAIAVDITDRVMLEKAMVQKERLELLGTVTSEVAHELRNPLMSIGGFAKRLKDKHPELQEPDIIIRECTRLENLVDRIKHYLEPIEITPGYCFINSIIGQAVELIEENTRHMKITVETSLAPDLPPVFMDKDILTQVFINLLQNAASAIGKDKVIHIRSYGTDSTINVDIKSSVLHQKFKDPEQIFLPFDENGQIMGLPLTYRLVKNMGGLLSISQKEKEVTFTVTLPVSFSQ